MNVFELEAKLKLNTKDYEKSLKSAEKDSKDFNKVLDKMEDKAEDVSDGIQDSFEDMADSAEDSLDDISDAAKDVQDSFGDMADSAEGACDDVQSAVDSIDIDVDTSSAVSSIEDIGDAAMIAETDISTSVSGINESLGGIGGAAQGALDTFAPAIGGMVTAIATGGVVGAIGGVVSAIGEIGEAAIENASMFQEAMGTIATGTGFTGEGLDTLYDSSVKTWGSFTDANLSLEGASSSMANLVTRLGLTEEETKAYEATLTTANESILKFAQVTNTDASQAINGVMDVMKQWGMTTGDVDTDIETMLGIMDQLTVAGESCDVNLGTLTSTLSEQAGAFQGLGYSTSEAMALLVAYEDAGGNASTMATGMYKAFNELNDVVDCAPAVWDNIMFTMQNADSVEEALNTTIGATGLTVKDVFGERNAQKIVNTFVNGGASANDFTGSLEGARGEVEKLYPQVVTLEDKQSALQNSMRVAANDILSGDGIVSAIGTLNGEVATSKAIYQEYVDYINSHPINAQINVSTSGSTSTGHATAMHRAELFSTKTFFTPTDYAGEAGNEILSGEQHLQSTVQTAVSSAMGSALGKIYGLLSNYLPSCASNKDVYLDGDKVSAGIYKKVNERINASEKFSNLVRGVR